MNGLKRTHWLRTTIIVLLACAVVSLVLSAVRFFRDPGPTYASATLVLTFDGAAAGTAPNGNAFDLRDLVCDEVLSEGLKAASLDEKYTPEQIRASFSISGVYPEDLAKQVMHYDSLLNFSANRELTVAEYHPTTFSILLYDNFDRSISRGELTELLKSTLDAYRTFFSRIYAFGLNMDDGVFSLDAYDYPQQLQILEERFVNVSEYAKELYEKNPSFRFNGVGFNDISVRLSSLTDNDIARLNAELTINALTLNTERMLTLYRYQIQELNNQREKQNLELGKLDKLIASYEKNEIIYLSTTDSLTKIDGNSSETYDALIGRRKMVADGITIMTLSIANYNQMISDLVSNYNALHPEAIETLQTENNLGNTDESVPTDNVEKTSSETAEAFATEIERKRAQLEESIRELMTEGDETISDFQDMLTFYNDQHINDLTITVTALNYKTPRLISGTFVKQAIKTTGPVVALGFIVCMVLIIISRKREEN